MDDILDMVAAEVERGKRLHPQEMDIIRFLGAAGVKMGAIEAKCHHHTIETKPVEFDNARIDLIHIAAMCVRCLEHLGGLEKEIYDRHVRTSNGYKFIDHAQG